MSGRGRDQQTGTVQSRQDPGRRNKNWEQVGNRMKTKIDDRNSDEDEGWRSDKAESVQLGFIDGRFLDFKDWESWTRFLGMIKDMGSQFVKHE